MSSLKDALHSPLVGLHTRPMFLDIRQARPTASLTTLSSPPPLASPMRISSLDSLRSVHSRAASDTMSIAELPDSPPVNASWWTSLLGEEDRADTVQDEQEHIRKKYRAPKHPLVFCHGLLGFDSVTIGPSIAPLQVSHWRGIKEVLEANGAQVLITRVPATSSPKDRAKVLEQKIEETFAGQQVHLIGHSMGGVDIRYLTTHLKDHTFEILSCTTIASPHRGSAFATHFLETIGKPNLPSFLSLLDLLPNGGGDGQAFECLTPSWMAKFNEETPNVPHVKYFSWGATFSPSLLDAFKYPHSVILSSEGPNDGLVSVESAKWGKYLGTLEGVNHLDLVGWVNGMRVKWEEMIGRKGGFKAATFYLGVADMLWREVEGGQDEGNSENGPEGDLHDVSLQGEPETQQPEAREQKEPEPESESAPPSEPPTPRRKTLEERLQETIKSPSRGSSTSRT
jgi:triacylglycerol lipase